ncbi:MAG: helix-turn-helix domain-containing protein [Desulfobulbaceae bacterium]|jgi:DNA-binding XRE family transcriptional regulator|nr:helix-turn-helix domain-containing protein [Desulfobulbaceae bacterium]
MLAVVKTPHTEVRIEGLISRSILDALKAEYGDGLIIEDDDEVADIAQETALYRRIIADTTPGEMLAALRWQRQMTQVGLAKMAGISPQNLSAMERGKRAIGWKMARKLAAALNVPPEKILVPAQR